jgi:glycosyltransferase involved in cell wall biosynthesis
MASGNGAHVIHRQLAAGIEGYRLCSYNPWWTLAPPALLATCRSPADIIHTTPDYAIFSARRKLPLVITFHNYVLDAFMAQYSTPLQRLHYATDLKWFTHMGVARARMITAVSTFTAALVSRELGLSADIRTIYNGIDETRFVPAGTAGKPDKKLRVLFSGNLSQRKGANLLPAIAAQLNPGIELLYTSGLRCRHSLPDHPALRGVGQVPYRAMPELYGQADILLFPTVREGFGLAAAEAMACGLPVVASDCSSLPELVVHGKGGYLCPVGDVAAFAARINELADAPALRREMGEYNRARVERKFTQSRMLREYAELFEQLMADPHGQA